MSLAKGLAKIYGRKDNLYSLENVSREGSFKLGFVEWMFSALEYTINREKDCNPKTYK